MKELQIKVTTTGSAGSATGEKESLRRVDGLIYRISINYHASAPGATTDVVVTHTLANGLEEELANVPNNATDIDVLNRIDETDAAGVASGTKTFQLVTGSVITVSVTGCDALIDAVNVSIQMV